MSGNLISNLSGLSLSPAAAPTTIESTRLAYSAWIVKPTADLLNPNAILDGDVHLEKYMKTNIAASQLPIVKDPKPLPMTIHPYTMVVEPTPKPNLLLIIATLFSLDHVEDSRSAWQTLSSYDIIMPRRILTRILANKFDEVDMYAWRPRPDGPLFIDRTYSYTTNPGSIGHQFGDLLVQTRSDHFRVYGVFKIVLGGRLKIAVTGEIDGVDEKSGEPIEIKTKPSWARPIPGRTFDNWLQATIGSVKSIITAGFTSQRGVRHGPVSFHSSNVDVQTVNEYHSPDPVELQCLQTGVKFLDDIVDCCTASDSAGLKMSYVKGNSDGATVQSEQDNSHCTMSKQLIEYIANMKWT